MFYIDSTIDTPKRYDMSKFIEQTGGIFDTLTSYLVKTLKTLPLFGVYVVNGSEKRPDLMSYHIYKDTQFWWLLMMYNDLLSPNDIVQGMSIRYFNLGDLEKLYLTLNSQARNQ